MSLRYVYLYLNLFLAKPTSAAHTKLVNMADTSDIAGATAHALEGVHADLRKAFPYLTEDALQSTLQAANAEIQRKLLEQ